MNNIVMEIKGNNAVVMNDSGDFFKVKNRNYTVGQRLEERAARQTNSFMRIAVAAASITALLAGGGAYAYCAPYTQVSLDVNPSIELSLNVFDRVIGVTALNEDAAQVLDQLRLLNCTLPSAAESIVVELESLGYIGSDMEADIMLTTASKDQTRAQDRLLDAIQSIERKTTELQIQASVLGECIGEDVQTRAMQYGVSPGKLRLAEQYALSTGNPEGVNLKDWLDKPVKEIVKAINANGGILPDNPTENGYSGRDKSDNGYTGGDKSANGQNGTPSPVPSPNPSATPVQNGYNGGDKDGNGYNGGDKSSNGTDPTATPGPGASPNQNGYNGGDEDDNGYSNGDKSGNSAAPAATVSPANADADQSGSGPNATACASPCPTCTGDGSQNKNGQGSNQ